MTLLDQSLSLCSMFNDRATEIEGCPIMNKLPSSAKPFNERYNSCNL